MIFLTVGTYHKGFDRLVKAVDQLKGAGIITDEVVAQIGRGTYEPERLTAKRHMSPDEFAENINAASVVVCHAGVGTISQAVKQKKPVVVVPRKRALGEHYDDHQFETAKALESEHKVLVAYDTNEIASKLKQARDFVPAEIGCCTEILDAIDKFLDNLVEEKGG